MSSSARARRGRSSGSSLPQLVMTTGAALRIALELVASIEADGGRRMDETRIGRLVALARDRYVAIAGGAVLVVVTIMTVVSVIGRALIPLRPRARSRATSRSSRPACSSPSSASCPGATYSAATPIVAILTDRFPTRVNVILEFVMDAADARRVAVFILWRFRLGLLDKIGNREMTLHPPLCRSGGPTPPGMLGAVTLLIVAAYCVVRSRAQRRLARTRSSPSRGSSE